MSKHAASLPACLTNCLTFFAHSSAASLSLSLSLSNSLSAWLYVALNFAAFIRWFYDILMEPSANLQQLNNCKLILIIMLAPICLSGDRRGQSSRMATVARGGHQAPRGRGLRKSINHGRATLECRPPPQNK